MHEQTGVSAPPASVPPQIEIIQQTDEWIAINKPSGLLVHRSYIDAHEVFFALQLVRDIIGQHVYPVHRLDKPTSGCLIFAKSSETARELSELWSQDRVAKSYTALTRGWFDQKQTGLLTVDHALKPRAESKHERKKMANKAPQDAVTHFQAKAFYSTPFSADPNYPTTRYSLVEATPITGRKHQIRRHLKHLSHPIIGDPKFGKSGHNHHFAERFGCERLFLHCHQLAFEWRGSRVTLNAQLSGDLQSALNRLAPHQV